VQVIWVGLPIMAQDSVLSNQSIKTLNAVYRSEARQHPGVTFLPSYKLFENKAGQFTEYLTNPSGMTTIVRDTDGVHIAPPAGQELVASDVLGTLDRLDHLHICPDAGDYWPEFTQASCP
jgi:hypothetical protein